MNRKTDNKVLLYINDSETSIKTKQEGSSRNGPTEKFWAFDLGEHKNVLDVKEKPLESYIEEDILNIIGYQKRKVAYEGQNTSRMRTNEYANMKKSIYSQQIYLPSEEFILMKNTEIETMVKKRPIDELFTILYIAQLPNTFMNDEIEAFIDDHGETETCCMLLQIICNPFEEYFLNVSKSSNSKNHRKKKTHRKYGYTSHRYEEVKGVESDSEEEERKETDIGKKTKPNEGLLNFAKSLFYAISNNFPSISRRNDFGYGGYGGSLGLDSYSQNREIQSVKLQSLLLYLSRILQPMFSNFVVYLTSHYKNANCLPNMGTSEKRVCGSKLSNLIKFIKNEDKKLKSLNKESKDPKSKGFRNYEERSHDHNLGSSFENLYHQESLQIDNITKFITRCIITVEFLEEISKVPDDFNTATKKLTNEERRVFEDLQFKHLTRDISQEKSLKSFIKRLLEVKAEQCQDLKDAKRMCEHWHSKCSAFVDVQFISVFISEYQLSKQLESKIKNDEIINKCINSLSRYPMKFEVDKVVFILVKLNKVKELIILL